MARLPEAVGELDELTWLNFSNNTSFALANKKTEKLTQ